MLLIRVHPPRPPAAAAAGEAKLSRSVTRATAPEEQQRREAANGDSVAQGERVEAASGVRELYASLNLHGSLFKLGVKDVEAHKARKGNAGEQALQLRLKDVWRLQVELVSVDVVDLHLDFVATPAFLGRRYPDEGMSTLKEMPPKTPCFLRQPLEGHHSTRIVLRGRWVDVQPLVESLQRFARGIVVVAKLQLHCAPAVPLVYAGATCTKKRVARAPATGSTRNKKILIVLSWAQEYRLRYGNIWERLESYAKAVQDTIDGVAVRPHYSFPQYAPARPRARTHARTHARMRTRTPCPRARPRTHHIRPQMHAPCIWL